MKKNNRAIWFAVAFLVILLVDYLLTTNYLLPGFKKIFDVNTVIYETFDSWGNVTSRSYVAVASNPNEYSIWLTIIPIIGYIMLAISTYFFTGIFKKIKSYKDGGPSFELSIPLILPILTISIGLLYGIVINIKTTGLIAANWISIFFLLIGFIVATIMCLTDKPQETN